MEPTDVLALLKSIEWRMPNAHGNHEWCPSCNGHVSKGHAPDCRLAASIVYMQAAEREHAALQAIADAEPAANTRAYDERCDGCLALIAMAREGLEASE